MEALIPEQLAALSHPKRLALFRLLMRRYPDSVAAGQIARALGLKANIASVYLSALRQAGLIEQRRVATSLHYSANLPQIRALFGALMGDCCQNRPDLCLPAPVAARGAGQKQTIEAAYELIERRIRAFVSLPLEQLPPVARQHAIDDIGRMQAQITQNPTDNPTDNSTGGND